ncbi:major capsid protein [Caudoviricetes sp.]|nr:major capsid protein [Caudoviricetes sp.]
MAYSTTSNNSALQWSYFAKRALDFVKANCVFMDVGDAQDLPKKHGKQMIWAKFRKLDAITSAGTEGTVPTLLAITSAQVTAAVSQYKNAVGYTDAFLDTSATEDVERFIDEVVAENMMRSLDTITRNALDTAIGTTIYGGGVSALSGLASTHKLTLPLAQQAANELRADDVAPHKSGYYVFIGHPNTLYDMTTDTASGGWIEAHKYTDAGFKKMFNAEAGTAGDIKFLSTTLVNSTNSGTSGSAYAYTNMMFGYQAFGVVKLNSKSMKLIHKKPGSSGVSDPVDELGSVGWKAWFVPKYFGNVSDVSDPDRAIKVITGRSA